MTDVQIEGLEAWVMHAEFMSTQRFEPDQLTVTVRPKDGDVSPFEFLRRVVEDRTIVLCRGDRWVVRTVYATVSAWRLATVAGVVLDKDARPREMEVTLICWPER